MGKKQNKVPKYLDWTLYRPHIDGIPRISRIPRQTELFSIPTWQIPRVQPNLTSFSILHLSSTSPLPPTPIKQPPPQTINQFPHSHPSDQRIPHQPPPPIWHAQPIPNPRPTRQTRSGSGSGSRPRTRARALPPPRPRPGP